MKNQLAAFKPRICGPERIPVALNWDTLLFQDKLYFTVLRHKETLTWLAFCWVSVFLLSRRSFPFPCSFRDERLTSVACFSAEHCVNFPKSYRCTLGCSLVQVCLSTSPLANSLCPALLLSLPGHLSTMTTDPLPCIRSILMFQDILWNSDSVVELQH